jgi:hypothetical protein
MILFVILAASVISAAPLSQDKQSPNEAKNIAQMNCGAQIECIMPDGRTAPIADRSSLGENPAALIMNDDTISCPLQDGDTTFVIALPNAALIDRLTFVNENAAARGDLKIAVSNYRLPANSEKWTTEDDLDPSALAFVPCFRGNHY